MISFTAASAAVAIFNPIGWAAFAGLQGYYWMNHFMTEREKNSNDVHSEYYFDKDRNR